MRPGDPIAVQQLFDSVSGKYDLLNDLFSLGLHRIWKKHLLSSLEPSAGEHWIDLCCGTGDLSFSLAQLVKPSGTVLGIDFSHSQILRASKRSLSKPLLPISWLERDALKTDLPSASFDGVVMAYGLRNLQDPEAGLKEVHRLLRPGAKAGVLDFNKPMEGTKTFLFQQFYLRNIVVPVSKMLGLGEEYSYLEKSLKNFPSGLLQEKIARKVGFKKANHKILAGGQMGILLLKV